MLKQRRKHNDNGSNSNNSLVQLDTIAGSQIKIYSTAESCNVACDYIHRMALGPNSNWESTVDAGRPGDQEFGSPVSEWASGNWLLGGLLWAFTVGRSWTATAAARN